MLYEMMLQQKAPLLPAASFQTETKLQENLSHRLFKFHPITGETLNIYRIKESKPCVHVRQMSARAPRHILLSYANLICRPENTTYRTDCLAQTETEGER